jgi:hypothetical protein
MLQSLGILFAENFQYIRSQRKAGFGELASHGRKLARLGYMPIS